MGHLIPLPSQPEKFCNYLNLLDDLLYSENGAIWSPPNLKNFATMETFWTICYIVVIRCRGEVVLYY